MGQGPYGPGPIWAPGPWAPGPSLLGKHLTKKRTLEKRVQIVFFVCFFGNKKDARRPYDHFGGGIAPRSLLCVRKQRFPFLKKDIILSVIWSVICPRNLPRNLPSEFATKKWSRKCPSNPTSTCAGGQDDVSSQVNSLKIFIMTPAQDPKQE